MDVEQLNDLLAF